MKLQDDVIIKARGDSGQKKKKSTRWAKWKGWPQIGQRQFILTWVRQQMWCKWCWDGGWDGRKTGVQSAAISLVKCVVTSSFEVKRKRGRIAHLKREEITWNLQVKKQTYRKVFWEVFPAHPQYKPKPCNVDFFFFREAQLFWCRMK